MDTENNPVLSPDANRYGSEKLDQKGDTLKKNG